MSKGWGAFGILGAALLVVQGLVAAPSPYVTKAEYLDLMEAAVASYSAERIQRYIAEVERDGVQEHGFPRLASNLGILVANGRLPEKRDGSCCSG